MKVLFLFREFIDAPNYLIRVQGESLKKNNIDIIYCPLEHNKIFGYVKNISKLRKYNRKYRPDIIHAHYSLTSILGLFVKTPTIASLMGSDVFSANKILLSITKLFIKKVWKATIVKSNNMKYKLNLTNVNVIPNGVSFEKFYPMKKNEAKKRVGFQKELNIIFVAANPYAHEKNLMLAQNAIKKINSPKIDFHIITRKKTDDLVLYYNAADLLLLSSISEGSPNVIKEAMACNCPIVSTKVGDVEENLMNTEQCIVVNNDENEMASAIMNILSNQKRSNGRIKIEKLEENKIAGQIISLYKRILD